MRLHSLTAASTFCLALVLVAAATAQPLRDELPPPPGTEASREAGFLGLFADDAIPPDKGVEVISVHPGGPSEAAGIKTGDLIAAIDGKPITNVDDLAKAIDGAAVGKKLKFDIARGGKQTSHVVTLTRRPAAASRPAERDVPLDPPVPSRGGLTPADLSTRATLGVRLLPLTEETRRRYSLTVRSGAVIEAIREGSAADKFGLPLGGVIVSFDGRRMDSPDEVVAALRGARPGDEAEIGYYQGDRMFRKLVRLSPVAATPTDPLSSPSTSPEPGVRPLPGLGDRPAVKKLEGLLDRLLPAPPGTLPEADAPRAADAREIVELRSEVELLKAELARMQKKLAEFEARLAAEKK